MLSLDITKAFENTPPKGTILSIPVPSIISNQLQYDSDTALSTVPSEDMHITLFYLENVTDTQINDLKLTLQEICSRFYKVKASVTGLAMFNQSEKDVQIALVDVCLDDIRYEIRKSLTQKGLHINTNHGFIPHITLAYLKKKDPNPYFPEIDEMTLDWVIDRLELNHKDEITWTASLK